MLRAFCPQGGEDPCRNEVTAPCGAAKRLGDAPQWAKQRETTRHLQLQGRRCKSAGEKAASPSDLEEFKRILKTQLLINLNDTKGAPRCTKQVKKTIGTATWSRLCILFAAPGASGVVKELHAKGEAAFMAEVGAKAQMWWNQSGNSEASKIKVAWAEDKKKKKMRDASSSDAEEPEAKRQTGASSSPASAPCAAVPTAGGASMRF